MLEKHCTDALFAHATNYAFSIKENIKVNRLSMNRGLTFLNITIDSLFEIVMSLSNTLSVCSSLEFLPKDFMNSAISLKL